MDRQTVMERLRQPHGPTVDQLSQEDALTSEKAASRPTTRSKTFGRITTNYNTPHLHLSGQAPARGPRPEG